MSLGMVAHAVSLGLSALFTCAPRSFGDEGAIAATPLPTSITYQGELKNGGTNYSGLAEFHFKLFDAATGGAQVGSTVNFEGPTAVTVSNGRFTVQLNFGASAFGGDTRWIEIETRTGLGPFTILTPRQSVAAAPYALYALNSPPNGQLTLPYAGSVSSGTTPALSVTQNSTATGSLGVASFGVIGRHESTGNRGTLGAPLFGAQGLASGGASGVNAENFTSSNYVNLGTLYHGVYATANPGSIAAVEGIINPSHNTGWLGTPDYGVEALANTNGYGVYGRHSSNNRGALGTPSFGVYAFGDFGGLGGKYFHIDYPLDPENKYLNHQCVEGPEPLLIYRGNVTLNADGQATVQLPEYFEAINRDFQYQLTPIGGAAPNLHIAQEVVSNTFAIGGGTPGLKVSWIVTGIRNDPYMQKHAKPVIEDKLASERGTYLCPELYGQPPERAGKP